MLKICCAGCFSLSPGISSQFSVEMCAASKNCEKFTKNALLKGSRSIKVIGVMINSMSVSVCNRTVFYTKRASNSSPFKGISLFDALVQGEPCTQGHEILSHVSVPDCITS